MRKEFRNTLINLSIVACATITTLLLVELGLRLWISALYFNPDTAASHKAYEILPDDPRAYGFRKSLAAIDTNSSGFRDDEFPAAKNPGALHVLMLGDSLMAGLELASQETVPARLERTLQQSSEMDISTFNLGVTGYNTAQQLATLRSVGLPLQPDIIVINLCLNDSDPIMRVWEAGLEKKATINGLSDLNLRTVIGASYVLTFIKGKLLSALKQINPEALVTLHDPVVLINPRVDESAWSGMKQTLLAMHELAREYGSEFLVTIYPYASQVELPRSEMVPQNDLIAFFDSHDIRYLDLTETYRGQAERMFSDGTLHLSAYGAERVADRIATEILELDWMRPSERNAEKPAQSKTQDQRKQQ